MAKFVYRMQNILDIKQKMEHQAKAAYGIANRQLAEEQEKLQQISFFSAYRMKAAPESWRPVRWNCQRSESAGGRST